MAKQDLNLGSTPNDGTGDPLRDAMDKVNDNFLEVYNALGGSTPTTIVTGGQLELTGANKVTSLYADLASLPSAASYHGMFAHVHATGGAYYAHAGSWLELANKSTMDALTTSSLTDVSSTAPTTGQVLKWSGTEWVPGADSAGGALGADAITTGMIAENVVTTREIAANTVAVGDLATNISVDFLSDVDSTTTPPTHGQSLVWNSAANEWRPGTVISGSAILNPLIDIHLNQGGPTDGYVLSWTSGDYSWVAQSGGGGGIALTDLSVGAEGSASGDGAIAYNSGTGVFTYTPPDTTTFLTSVVFDTTPQLGGDLDINGKTIVSTSNGDISITPNGSGKVILDGLSWPIADGTAGQQLTTDGSGTLSWAASGGGGGAPQAFAGIAVAGQSQVIADGNADTLTFAAGSGIIITTNSVTDTITFASTAAGADTQVQYNNSGAFGAEAGFTYNAGTNTLSVPNLVATNITATGAGTQTITAGTNIELDATNRVLVTDTPFRLASFNTAGRDAIAGPTNGDMIYNTTTTQIESYENSAWGVIGLKSPTFAVSAPDSSAYQFNGAGTTADNNPTLYLRKGETYIFDMNSSGHPFYIQTSSGAYNSGNVYTDTITNSGAQSGIISWTIQMDAPATLYYVCQYHAAMAGTINIS